VSALPQRVRSGVAELIAVTVYFPLARAARLLELVGVPVETLPLSAYRRKPFFVMRTDALDRFGTRVEHRFTADEVKELMEAAGLTEVVVDRTAPYWCAVGRKA
jgi:hypothetical protein